MVRNGFRNHPQYVKTKPLSCLDGIGMNGWLALALNAVSVRLSSNHKGPRRLNWVRVKGMERCFAVSQKGEGSLPEVAFSQVLIRTRMCLLWGICFCGLEWKSKKANRHFGGPKQRHATHFSIFFWEGSPKKDTPVLVANESEVRPPIRFWSQPLPQDCLPLDGNGARGGCSASSGREKASDHQRHFCLLWFSGKSPLNC